MTHVHGDMIKEVNMSKEFNKHANQVASNDHVEEPMVKDESVTDEKSMIGIVTKCSKLNVRSQPDATDDKNIICTIPVDAEVVIDDSTSDFYAITTKDGKHGFCMKEYITVN